jgi:hypothetical protein
VLVSPFVVWGALVVVGFAVGCYLIGAIPGPVAMFAQVNYVNVSKVDGH